MIVGNTEIGIETKFKAIHYPVMIAATHVPELADITETQDGTLIGAAVTLAALEAYCQKRIKSMAVEKVEITGGDVFYRVYMRHCPAWGEASASELLYS